MTPPAGMLPTLLTSRPRAASPHKTIEKGTPVARQQKKLPEKYSMPVRVRNTFIDTLAERSPSLERFYSEREVSTCPSSHIGRLRSPNLFDEDDAEVTEEAGVVTDCKCQGSTPETMSIADSSCSSSAGPPTLVLSLSDALGQHFQPPLAELAECWGEQQMCGGTYDPNFGVYDPVYAAEAAPVYGTDVSCSYGFTMEPMAWAEALPVEPSIPPMLAEPSVPAPPDRPAVGSEELPSKGSAGHSDGTCKPCAFFHTAGCKNGLTCEFCHLCDSEERKRRRKAKYDARRAGRLGRAGLSPGEDE